MFRSILPFLAVPFVGSVLSEASPVHGIHPGHGGPPGPPMAPSLELPSYLSAALPTPSMIPSHDDSQMPLDGKPIDVSHPVKPSPSLAGRAVYYGQNSSPEDPTLEALCKDPAIDTVILGHVHSFRSTNGFPIVDFGSSCPGKHAEDDPYAPGLASCPELGRQVQACQAKHGKKVFLSIGGRRSETTPDSTVDFADASDARRAAVMLWSLFGQGDPHGPDMRPLGDAAVDGFDFAWTDQAPSPPSIRAFASTLRSLATRRNHNYKPCHLSTTPACATAPSSDYDARELLRDLVDVAFAPEPAAAGGGGCAGPRRRLEVGKSLDDVWAAAS